MADEAQVITVPADEEDAIVRLEMLGARLSRLRQRAIDARVASGIERRWTEDMDAFQGRDSATNPGDVVTQALISVGQQLGVGGASQSVQRPVRATTFVQLTRQKTNTAAARLADMLYPTDDRNWGIRPTPVPELAEVLKTRRDEVYLDPQSGGKPLRHPVEDRDITYGDLALELMAKATLKAQAMEREIDDALNECQYNREGRKAIMDAAILGTGILRGPIVTNRVSKRWRRGQSADGKTIQILEIREETRPASVRVDPWNFYPDPGCGDDIHSGGYTWERSYVGGRQLRNLAKVGSYFADQINECLHEGPRHYGVAGGYRPLEQGDGDYGDPAAIDDSRYELWTYVGDLTYEDLVAARLAEEADPDDKASHLDRMSVVLVMCNERVIYAAINPLETEELCYDVFVWDRLAMSPWGVGIPRLMRYAQATINTAWRAMLDNAALSHGPQIVMRRQQIRPADGRWEITGRKLWYASDEVDEVKKAFELYDIPSRQAELQRLIEMAMMFADEETSLPKIAQGEQGAAPDTVGGMSILMNSANVVLRRLVKQFDDTITTPHIRRYYDWFMQYSDKEEIKGDFQIDARGSSVLLVRDLQQQMLAKLLAAVDHPVFGRYIDPEKLFRKLLESGHVPPSDVMRTKEEIAQLESQQQQAAPPVQVQVAQIRAQADVERTKIDTESERVNQQMRMQQASDNAAARLHEMQLERDTLVLKLAHERGLSIEKIKADLAKAVIQERGRRQDRPDARIRQAQAMAKGPIPRQNGQSPAMR